MTGESVSVNDGDILVTRGDSRLQIRRGDGAVRVDCSWVLDASTDEWFRFSDLYPEWDYLAAVKAATTSASADVASSSGSVLRLSRLGDGRTGFEMIAGSGPSGRTLYLTLAVSLPQLAFVETEGH